MNALLYCLRRVQFHLLLLLPPLLLAVVFGLFIVCSPNLSGSRFLATLFFFIEQHCRDCDSRTDAQTEVTRHFSLHRCFPLLFYSSTLLLFSILLCISVFSVGLSHSHSTASRAAVSSFCRASAQLQFVFTRLLAELARIDTRRVELCLHCCGRFSSMQNSFNIGENRSCQCR